MTYQPHHSEDVTLKTAQGEVIERDGLGPRTPLRWPVAQPANTDSVPGSPASKVTRPDEQDAPGSSIGLGAEGEQ